MCYHVIMCLSSIHIKGSKISVNEISVFFHINFGLYTINFTHQYKIFYAYMYIQKSTGSLISLDLKTNISSLIRKISFTNLLFP